MSLRIYNTLTQTKEIFTPVRPGKVGIYLCGPTVYKPSHIGHAVGPIIFDTIKRYLKFKGFEVTWVVNITDVDDKLIAEAREQGCGVLDLAGRVTAGYLDAISQLGVTGIDHMPKASEHMGEIVSICERLIAKGAAYVSNGDVYFDVTSSPHYGKLSHRRAEDQQSGTRDLAGEQKKNPGDFALWKAAKPDEPAEVQFDSPWGKGRPGWHIECSAMSWKYLGETFDIHGGGMDLIFPHHENEILQSESVTNKPLANYWMHNGMLQVADAKMSKSLKNFFSVKDILARYQPEVVRFYLLNTHYRGPLVYGEAALDEAAASLKRLHNTYESLRSYTPRGKDGAEELVVKTKQGFLESMDDDFNSRGALSFLFDLAREANRLMDSGELSAEGAANIISMFNEMNAIFDVLPEERKGDDKLDDVMLLLIDIRKELRKRKMYDLSDLIRDRLQEAGIKIEDTSEGAKWKLI